MNYFESQGRKYQVRVRLIHGDQTQEFIEVPMFSNSHLDDVRDIIEDFLEKIDCYPSRYGVDLTNATLFEIVSMRDRKGRAWINDPSVYGGMRLEAAE